MTLESRGIETHHGMGQFSLKSSPKTCRQRPSVCRPQGFGSGVAGLCGQAFVTALMLLVRGQRRVKLP